jgi:hypothetical protein
VEKITVSGTLDLCGHGFGFHTLKSNFAVSGLAVVSTFNSAQFGSALAMVSSFQFWNWRGQKCQEHNMVTATLRPQFACSANVRIWPNGCIIAFEKNCAPPARTATAAATANLFFTSKSSF